MKLKKKNILVIAILAVAGLFGTASAVVNQKVNEEPVVEKAEAAISGTTLYFENYWNYSNPYVHYWGGTSSTTWPGAKMINTGLDLDWNSASRDIYSVTVASGTTTVKFSDNGNNGDGDHTITNGANMMIQRSHQWVYWDGSTDCWRGQNRTIYFTRQGWEYWTTNYVHAWNVGLNGTTWGSNPSMTSVGTYDVGGNTYYLSSVDIPAYCVDFIFKNAVGDTDKRVQTSLALNATATVYDGDAASWKAYITYDKNGGSGTNTFSVTGSGENLKSISDCGFAAPANKEFKGWSTSPSGSVQYEDEATYDGGNTILYAIWDYKVHSITLNNQSATSAGTGAIYEKYNTGYYKDSSCTQKMTTSAYAISTPTKTGYDFGGYYTQTGGSGTQYIGTNGYLTSSASTTHFTSDDTLYAKWTPKVLTITLDNQSATSAGTGTIYEKYNTGYYLENSCTNKMSTSTNGITVPTKTGYTFGGYYTAKNGGGTQYIGANGKLTSSASTTHFSAAGTLYAKWTVKTSALTFNLNGGSGTAPTGKTATYGSSMPSITDVSAPTKTGFTFAGYYDGEGGTGTQYYTSSRASARNWDKDTTSGTTLYAKWEVNEYTYTIGTLPTGVASLTCTRYSSPNKGAATGTIANNGKVYYGDKLYWSATPSTGYEITSIDYNSTSNLYTVGTSNVVGVTVTSVTATVITYTISYDLDGGEVESSNPSSYNITSSDITLNNPTKEGYDFSGWTGSNGDTPQTLVTIASGSTGDKSYTANWSVNSYNLTLTISDGIGTIYYKVNGASNYSSTTSTKIVSVEYGTTYYVYATKANDGYVLNSPYSSYSSGSPYSATKGASSETWAPTATSGEDAAITYATNFNTSIGGTCKNDGSTSKSALATAWGTQSTNYSGLASHVKYWLNASHASSDSNVTSMFAKYDYVYGKYHDDLSNNDFLDRKPALKSAIASFSPLSLFAEEDDLSTIIIIAASSVALLSVTALSILVIKKRKNKEE